MHPPKSQMRFVIGLCLALACAGVCAGWLWNGARAGDGGGSGEGRRTIVKTAAQRQLDRLTLDGGVAWINTAPLKMEDLRGKIVILDFWTYCCINCHHIIPVLAKLEEKYPNDIVVIGVHTPKFFAERDTENIRRKVREYKLKHPVINDANQTLWDRFGVQSWPTIVVLGPNGEPLAKQGGEVPFDILDKYIGREIQKFKAKGAMKETPVQFFPEIEKPDNTPLLFPGKILADGPGKRLFISDTGHSRIVITSLDGKVQQVFGNGVEGLNDGPADKAQFNRQQGMCLVENTLYVADTENHALRAIDLKAKTVKTVAGTGQQTYKIDAHGPGLKTPLTSPWDVIQVPGTKTLLIAMAGHHQIWRFEMESEMVGVWAGSGQENIIDGPPGEAAFAQPSGLATDGKFLYVADSEVSGIRAVSLEKNKHLVQTVVGVGLFGFGDIDGVGDEVRLQHCLGVAYDDDKLYIADTYNNKIKVCYPSKREVKTILGNKTPGDSDDPPRFYQPGGLSVANMILYVADTNNHAIRAVDLKSGTVKTLDLSGLKPPTRPRPKFNNALLTEASKAKVSPTDTVTLNVTLPLAEKQKVNAEPDSITYVIETVDKDGLVKKGVAEETKHVSKPEDKFSVEIPLTKVPASGQSLEVKLSVSAFVCDADTNLCQVKNYIWTVPIAFADRGADSVSLKAQTK